MVFFYFKGYRCLIHFYIHYVQKHIRSEFPETISYNRFVELQSKSVLPMVVFLQTCCLGKCSRIPFLDSTILKVCHYKKKNKTKSLNTSIIPLGEYLLLSFIPSWAAELH